MQYFLFACCEKLVYDFAISGFKAPVIQLVLMIDWISAQHEPLIYCMQVNFVMFSFKTVLGKKTEMTNTCKNFPWQALQFTFSAKAVINLFYH